VKVNQNNNKRKNNNFHTLCPDQNGIRARAYPELLWTVWRQKASLQPLPGGERTLYLPLMVVQTKSGYALAWRDMLAEVQILLSRDQMILRAQDRIQISSIGAVVIRG